MLDRAKSAYDSGDYAEALTGYYTCLKEQSGSFGPGESGLVHHMLGNCLMKMSNFEDAASAYEKSLQDTAYDNLTSVRSNYGLTLSALGEPARAIEQFEAVLRDPSYPTPYKAYNGLGNTYMQMGDFAAAGTAFRNAAVDNRNPAPVKALLNLGVCFMGLGRPADAIDTYRAIFEFNPDRETLSKTYANMGQAYVAEGKMAEAVKAFDKASGDSSYMLSTAAMADYFKAKSALAHHDDSGIDALEDASAIPGSQLEDDYYYYDDADEPYSENATYGAGIPSADDTGFFELPDDGSGSLEELMKSGSLKKSNRGLKIVLVFVLLIVLVIAAAGLLYWQGYGWPTQEQTIQSLFDKTADGEDASDCWITASSDEDRVRINRIMNSVVPTSDITIDYLERGTIDSNAIVTATTSEGGEVRYEISFTRDFSGLISWVGWKINGIEIVFPSVQAAGDSGSDTGTAMETSDDA